MSHDRTRRAAATLRTDRWLVTPLVVAFVVVACTSAASPTPVTTSTPRPSLSPTAVQSRTPAPTLATTPAPTAIPTSSWVAAAGLIEPRQSHTATVLLDGHVLVAGGYNDADWAHIAETYDPTANAWIAAGSIRDGRNNHTATLLPSGDVLIVGGGGAYGLPIASAELYHPSTRTWTSTADMAEIRGNHTATPLPDGRVLVVGGATDADGHAVVASAELYDPATRSWTRADDLTFARQAHTATLLVDGRVLVAGGIGEFVSPVEGVALAAVEIYDPKDGRWTVTDSLAVSRFGHTSTLLSDGTVLVAGGTPGFGTLLASAERYDPDRGTWVATGDMVEARHGHVATLRENGTVLIAGGSDNDGPLALAEVFDLALGSWVATMPMTATRQYHASATLPDGDVLVIGGNGSGEATAERYHSGGS